jgi:hypothetical protein
MVSRKPLILAQILVQFVTLIGLFKPLPRLIEESYRCSTGSLHWVTPDHILPASSVAELHFAKAPITRVTDFNASDTGSVPVKMLNPNPRIVDPAGFLRRCPAS